MNTDALLPPPLPAPTSWDIFCRVIDNHGDLGVCWRLSADLAQRGHSVRLWIDDASALAWMAPPRDRPPGLQVLDWDVHGQAQQVHAVVIEAFGCELPESIQSLIAQQPDTLWLNLEYLSAEPYVARQHGLPSPVMQGPAKGHTKWFFYPGFTTDTGGLLREPDWLTQRARFDKAAWLRQLPLSHPITPQEQLISLFCYEPEPLQEWLQQLQQDPTPTRLLVTPGRAQRAVQTALNAMALAGWGDSTHLRIEFLPYLSQTDYDRLLWACDLNLVRGEDSLVRAIWAGQPWGWQIYPQHDQAHHVKLQALCECLQMPADLQTFHLRWNAVSTTPLVAPTRARLEAWHAWAAHVSATLQSQPDLTHQLLRFVAQKR